MEMDNKFHLFSPLSWPPPPPILFHWFDYMMVNQPHPKVAAELGGDTHLSHVCLQLGQLGQLCDEWPTGM